MNRIQLACYCLIASAAVLAGCFFLALQNRLPDANASMLNGHGDPTYLTCAGRQGEDVLYVMDTRSERLLIYIEEIGRNRINLAHTEDIAADFSKAFAAPK